MLIDQSVYSINTVLMIGFLLFGVVFTFIHVMKFCIVNAKICFKEDRLIRALLTNVLLTTFSLLTYQTNEMECTTVCMHLEIYNLGSRLE